MHADNGGGSPAPIRPERSFASGSAQPASVAANIAIAITGLARSMSDGYSAAMHLSIGILLFVATVTLMEGFAYVAHRWVMHGPGWFLHASHHRPRTGAFEWNDLYAVIFAVPSFVLLLGGVQLGWWPGYAWIGAGIAAYGAIYFGFHDVIVHRRIGHRYVPRSAYMKRIMQAHRLHHVVETREGNVSFGFLWAPRPEKLKAELKRLGHHGVRAPTGVSEPHG
jgi:beta-carotene 3-hydroxylase